MGVLLHFVRAAGDLAALAEHLGAVGIRVFDGVVIEDVAVLFAGADLAAAHALGFDGVAILDPVADIEIVDVLLADVIAAEPGEEVPVANLVFELREICRGRTVASQDGRRSSSSGARRDRRFRRR